MPVQLFTNNAVTLLDASILIGDLVLTVTGGDGALFPSPTAGDWFYATIELGSLREIVQVTARSTDTFTIVRGQDGTAAMGWTAGAKVELRANKAWFDTVHTENSLPAAGIGDVDGPAGGVVDNEVAFFNGTTGKIVKGSGLLLSGSNTGDQVISDATLSTTDITTNDVSTSKHGFAPKGTNVGRFLNDSGGYSDPTVPGSLPEAVINGHMQLWQRGTSFTSIASAAHSADRWRVDYATSAVMDMVRQALGDATIQTATGQRIPYGLRTSVTTADASIAAGDFHVFSQAIEGYRALPYLHNQYTISFYARSSITGTYCLSVRNVGAPPPDRTFLKTFTIDVADTWERKTIVVATQDATGTWNYGNGIGMRIGISLMSGTTFEGSDDTWQSGNLLNVTGGTNFFAATSRTFDFTGMQLDLGPRAYPYRGLSFADDLLAAQRYYRKSYNVDVDPAATSALGQLVFRAHGTNHLQHVAFNPPMRSAPTIVLLNPTDGTAAQWEDVGAGAGVAMTSANIGMNGFEANVTTSIDLNEVNGHYTAEAEL